jgi:phasin family protein
MFAMFTTDFSKLFDPTQYAANFQQNIQKMWDMSQAATASKQNMETMKKVGTIVADTLTTCTEKQFKYAQSTMEDCIEAMRELSTSKGMEDYMQKQAELSKRSAEKAQSTAQEIASQWQKTQSQCSDIISKQISQATEWSKSFTGNSNGSGK